VVFTSLDLPANATLVQLTPYTEQVGQMFASAPEFDSSFQLMFERDEAASIGSA
jgi:multidrug efflux pump